MRPLERVLDVLEVVRGPDATGERWAFCPAHDDRNTPNLHVGEAEDGSVLLRCFAGCEQTGILSALEERGVRRCDLFVRNGDGGAGEGGNLPSKKTATVQPHPGSGIDTTEKALHPETQPTATAQHSCTLEEYAEAKTLPVEFLRGIGLSTISYMGNKAVRIPYLNEDGSEGAVRLRISQEKSPQADNRFRWRKGSKPTLYGLWRMEQVREANYVVLVEGESDCHTLYQHGIEALGVPGAANWKEEWAAHLDGIEKIYAIVEPDEGGATFEERLSASTIRDRLYLVGLEDAKDASDLHLRDPALFKQNLRAAFKRARLWTDTEREEAESRVREAWEHCKQLAYEERILDRFAPELGRLGLAGETRAAKLLYLALTSRLLEKIASVAVKGPSSGRQDLPRGASSSLLPRERLLCPDRHEREDARLLRGAHTPPFPRHLRGRGHVRRLRHLPHAFPALRRPCPLRDRREHQGRHTPTSNRAGRTHRPNRHHHRRQAPPRKRDQDALPDRHRYPGPDQRHHPRPGEGQDRADRLHSLARPAGVARKR